MKYSITPEQFAFWMFENDVGEGLFDEFPNLGKWEDLEEEERKMYVEAANYTLEKIATRELPSEQRTVSY